MSGHIEPPRKIYRTCTFEDLGSKKDEFLGRVSDAMKERGLEELPPVKPFGHHLGVKDALRLWDMSLYHILALQQMVGTDVLLGYDKGERHLRMGLRAEAKGENLRFGYFYTGEKISPLKSPEGIKFILGLIAYMVLLFLWIVLAVFFLPWKPFIESHGLTVSILIFITIVSSPLIPLYYIVHKRETRPRKEIDQRILDIAESMGSRQITPFKKTTVRLEEPC